MLRRTSSYVVIVLLALLGAESTAAGTHPPRTQERVVQWTVESRKIYADPFNDVDVDVVFTRGDKTWRVPMFWRGENQWTVRFAPPVPGRYGYRLESTDRSNPDLNDQEGQVEVTPYRGDNALLKHGMLKVSANRRHFEHADGTPFYWLGDIWWTGLSDRVSWQGFQELVADRKAKGFTVVQTVAGLIPPEETCPEDPGCRNEGGGVWEPGFSRINPRYFDHADRRIDHLIQSGIVPAIVGAWFNVSRQAGFPRIKKHWRYIIARYGAYPVFWVAGGEISDPPAAPSAGTTAAGGGTSHESWSDVARYIRATDPYQHPLTAHEAGPAETPPLQEESLTDFTLLQPGSYGWGSIAILVAQLNTYYARTAVTKPLVIGEVGIEMLGKMHLEDFQRVAFWLSMLNGAAGHTYGAAGLFEAVAADKPLQRKTWSFLSWREGMNLPGSYQLGIGANLLRRYPWWQFVPRPDWVTPGGTTLLEPRDGVDRFHVDVLGDAYRSPDGLGPAFPEEPVKPSEWQRRNGDFRLPYAAGIPGKVRIIYIPSFTVIPPPPPTVLALEPGVRYRAYYWDPSMGIEIDLGNVQRPDPGALLIRDGFSGERVAWIDHARPATRTNGRLSPQGSLLSVVSGLVEEDVVAEVAVRAATTVGLLFRYKDDANYLAAFYSPKQRSIYWVERKGGVDGPALGWTSVTGDALDMRLTAEVRGNAAIVSVEGAGQTSTTPIVTLSAQGAGGVGLISRDAGNGEVFRNFEVRRSPPLPPDEGLQKRIFDARGVYRGTLDGAERPSELLLRNEVSWNEYGKSKHLLLNAYRPEVLPVAGDWVLVLHAK